MPDETSAPRPVGSFERLTGSLFADKEAFADIAARPRGWWLPLLLMVVVSLATLFAFEQRVGWERGLRRIFESNPRVQQLSPEQREQALQQQLRIVPYLAYGGAVLGTPVLALILGGVFLFVFNVILGGQLRLGQTFALCCYGLLPLGVKGVLSIVTLFLKAPADFDIQNPVASNIGAFLDPNTAPAWAVSLGTSIDLFNLWVVVLLATGFAAGARKLAWSKSLTWVALTWVVWLVLKTGWAWIWS